MSLSTVGSRIAEIQAQLAQFVPTAATSGTTDTSTSTSAADFATALGRISTGTSGSTAGDAVVADAMKYLGVPYVWGGTDPATGLDCSGLVQRVYADLGYSLPRVSGDQARAGTAVPSLDQAQPGDILAFGSPVHHVAIYIGNGEMIQAPHTGESVETSKVADFGEPVAAIRRIIPDGSGSAGLSARVSTAASSATPYASAFASAAARTGVPASLLAAVAKQESGFNPTAVSPVGAEGLMQLMPGTAKSLGVSDPMNPTQAINGAADYLRTLINQFGSTKLALAAYNAGPGAVLKYNGVPPYPETQSYVRNVLSAMGAAS
jgi:hypothetical protein